MLWCVGERWDWGDVVLGHGCGVGGVGYCCAGRDVLVHVLWVLIDSLAHLTELGELDTQAVAWVVEVLHYCLISHSLWSRGSYGRISLLRMGLPLSLQRRWRYPLTLTIGCICVVCTVTTLGALQARRERIIRLVRARR